MLYFCRVDVQEQGSVKMEENLEEKPAWSVLAGRKNILNVSWL